MSRTVTHYLDGHPQYRDDGPGRARIANRGGLALGQALTATEVRPVAAGSGEPVTPPLRGAVLDASQRRKR